MSKPGEKTNSKRREPPPEKLGSAFTDILAQATRKTRGVVGAVFLDDEGEPIDEYGLGSDLDLQITGAHMGLILEKLAKRLSRGSFGRLAYFTLECEQRQLLAHRVADTYVVVFVVEPQVPLDKAIVQLLHTANALERAI